MWFIEKLISGDNEEEQDEELVEESEDNQDESADEDSDENKKSEKKEVSQPANDIEKLRKEVVNAYLQRLNNKNLVKGMLRGKNIKAQAREYILEPKQAEEEIDLSWLNLPPEISQFATALKGGWSSLLPSMLQKFTGISIWYDEEKELNPMKELMAKAEYKNDAKALEELKKSIKSGVDIKTLLAAPVVVWTGVVAMNTPNSTNSSNTVSESSNVTDLKAEGIDKYFTVLTWSTNVDIHNANARKTVETMNTSCTFFGKDITVNKYMVHKLEEVEKEIKDSGIAYPIDSIWWYNRRNISWWDSLSYHSLWLALDINPAKNPFVMTSWGKIPTDMPKEFVNIFRKHGFVWWGDRWKESRNDEYKADAMHFQFQDENYLKEQMQKDVPAMAA